MEIKNKITKITERLPKEVVLEDGFYTGIWGAYCITISYKGKSYELATEIGVKGIGIMVVVQIKNGTATFEELKN